MAVFANWPTRRVRDVDVVKARQYDTVEEVRTDIGRAKAAANELVTVKAAWGRATAPVRRELDALNTQARQTHGTDGRGCVALTRDEASKAERRTIFAAGDAIRSEFGKDIEEWRKAGQAVRACLKTINLLEKLERSFKPKKVSPQGNLF